MEPTSGRGAVMRAASAPTEQQQRARRIRRARAAAAGDSTGGRTGIIAEHTGEYEAAQRARGVLPFGRAPTQAAARKAARAAALAPAPGTYSPYDPLRAEIGRAEGVAGPFICLRILSCILLHFLRILSCPVTVTDVTFRVVLNCRAFLNCDVTSLLTI